MMIVKTVLALAAVLAVAVSASALASTGPRALLADLSPVHVVGAGFEPGVAVHVTVSTPDRKLSKIVRSTATGTFSARWATTLQVGGCIPVGLRAWSAHRQVTVKTVPSGAKDCGALRAPVDP